MLENKGDDLKRTKSEIIALNRYGLKKALAHVMGRETAKAGVLSQEIFMIAGMRMLKLKQRVMIIVRTQIPLVGL